MVNALKVNKTPQYQLLYLRILRIATFSSDNNHCCRDWPKLCNLEIFQNRLPKGVKEVVVGTVVKVEHKVLLWLHACNNAIFTIRPTRKCLISPIAESLALPYCEEGAYPAGKARGCNCFQIYQFTNLVGLSRCTNAENTWIGSAYTC